MQKNQRLSSSFDTTKANAKGTEDRSPKGRPLLDCLRNVIGLGCTQYVSF
jgi:hypothetical protein